MGNWAFNMKYDFESVEGIRILFKDVTDRLYENHGCLIKRDLDERTISGCLMHELNILLGNERYNDKKIYADIEYNRNGLDPKRIINIDLAFCYDDTRRESKSLNEKDDYKACNEESVRDKLFRPDIIIHTRNINNDEGNLVVVEVKKRVNGKHHDDIDFDLLKLARLYKDNNYQYKHHIYYEYDKDNKKDVKAYHLRGVNCKGDYCFEELALFSK